MSIRLDDFIGFEWNNHHSSEFNLKVVSNSDRYDSRFLSNITNNLVDIPGQDGQYFYNSYYGPKKWNINIAFDNVTETMQRDIENWLSSKELSPLTFDERPYKSYMAKLDGRPSITWLCFDEPKVTGSETAPRIYKGEGTLDFIAPVPYAASLINQDEYMKFIDQFEFKKNTYLPPKKEYIKIQDNSGGYINKERYNQVLELNAINLILPLTVKQDQIIDSENQSLNEYYSFIGYTLPADESLKFKQGSKLLEFYNNTNKNLFFGSFGENRNLITYNDKDNKYHFISKILSIQKKVLPQQHSITLEFNKEDCVIWDSSSQPIENILISYPFNYETSTFNIVYYKDTNLVKRIIFNFQEQFENIVYFDLILKTLDKDVCSFNTNKITYNLKNKEGIQLIYIKNDNEDDKVIKELEFNCYETLYYNLSEWREGSHLISNLDVNPYDVCYKNNNYYAYPVVNSGDIATPFEITIPLKELKLNNEEIIIALSEDEDEVIFNSKYLNNYFDFSTKDIYINNNIEYYLIDKRVDNGIFKLYLYNTKTEEIEIRESNNGLFDNFVVKTINNSKILDYFILKFPKDLNEEYSNILKNFSRGSNLIINTYKQTIDLEINFGEDKVLIPMHFLLAEGDLFKIPVSEFKLSEKENIKLDNRKILVYDNNSIIDTKIKNTKLKYRFLYY